MLQFQIRSEVAVEADLTDARVNGRTATVLIAIAGLLHGKAGLNAMCSRRSKTDLIKETQK